MIFSYSARLDVYGEMVLRRVHAGVVCLQLLDVDVEDCRVHLVFDHFVGESEGDELQTFEMAVPSGVCGKKYSTDIRRLPEVYIIVYFS